MDECNITKQCLLFFPDCGIKGDDPECSKGGITYCEYSSLDVEKVANSSQRDVQMQIVVAGGSSKKIPKGESHCLLFSVPFVNKLL